MPIFYALKSLFSRPMQIRIRSAYARRKRASVGGVWPILESAGTPPSGWKGWPNGKQFALVLTHDVETARGVERCRMIMDIEERLGFRSAFNFVPDRYEVPVELRQEMVQRGFEVAVHGLRHDLTLFRSEQEFKRQAQDINRYIREWGAVGFRSPYMIRNLAWIRDHLNIEYDSSTFDTDPFEPQPDGVGTIFPFIVDGHHCGRQGYVELPCTLPQDMNLLVLLGESSIEVWKTKLDWIVSRSGMALFDTHPDYMQSSDNLASDEYPVRRYEEFLEHVRVNFQGQYWQALPREVACHVRQSLAPVDSREERDPKATVHSRGGVGGGRHPLRVCLVGPLFYDSDNRTMRYAEALRDRGDVVDVISLRRPGQARQGIVNGVNVFRIQERIRNEKGAGSYLVRLISFLIRSFGLVSWRHLKQPYDIIHAHSIPDFQVFSALIPKLTGAKVVLDIYDVLPEFYLSKFGANARDSVYKMLLWQERISARFAHHIISANHLWQDKLAARAVPRTRCTPFINYIDTRLFWQRSRQRNDSRYIVVYPGVLNWHQGVDICIRAFGIFCEKVPGSEFHIYGEGPEKASLARLIATLGVMDRVFLKDPVPLADIPQIMADCDMGLVGKRADVFGNEAYSTKILEYMSQSLPAVVPRTAIDAYYFNDSVVAFYEPGNPSDMAAKMMQVFSDKEFRTRLVHNGLDYVKTNSWEAASGDYLALVDRLVNRS